MKKHHYVYHSYEQWGREYIGIRSCNCLPEEDIKYLGSFKDKSFKPLEKTILFVCETRKEAAEIEIKLHDFFDVAVNPKFANKAKATSTKFDTTGVPRTEAQKQAHSERMSGKTHTEEQKKTKSERMSGKKNHRFGVPHTEEIKKKISVALSGENNPRFGAPRTEEIKKKISEALSGENHPQYGVPRTEEIKKKISEALKGKYAGKNSSNYGKTGALSHNSKAIIAIQPDGTKSHYGSIIEAARDLEINQGNLCKYIRDGRVLKWGKSKGWQFFYKNPEDFEWGSFTG